jgi:hypothetical protein
VGVVITTCKSGKSTVLDCQGAHNIAVPSSTVKGDLLYANIAAGGTDATTVTLTRTATSGYRVIGKVLTDRDSGGKSVVLLNASQSSFAP